MWNWEHAKAFREDKAEDVTLPPIFHGLVLPLQWRRRKEGRDSAPCVAQHQRNAPASASISLCCYRVTTSLLHRLKWPNTISGFYISKKSVVYVCFLAAVLTSDWGWLRQSASGRQIALLRCWPFEKKKSLNDLKNTASQCPHATNKSLAKLATRLLTDPSDRCLCLRMHL